jgi:thioredoxin-related protein
MKRLIYIITLAFASVAFTADKSWLGFDEGLAKSLNEQKPMLVDFYTDWCHWCKVMDEKTFNEENVKAKLTERFVTVRLNAEDRNVSATYKGNTYTNVELTQAFGVTGFPTLAFLDGKGEIITTIPGYVPAENFIHILSYIDQKMYEQKMPFEEFVKLQEAKEKK